MSLPVEERLLNCSPFRNRERDLSRALSSALTLMALMAVGWAATLSLRAAAPVFDEDDEPAAWAKLSPEQLTRRACSICHIYPEPGLLTKKNWREQILPRMSVELGVFAPDYSSSPEGELLRQKKIYSEIPRIPKELWPKIEEYILSTAPDQPAPQEAHPEIGIGMHMFEVIPPRFRQAPPTTTLVKISPKSHRLFVGDDHSKKLSVLNPRGELLQSIDVGNVPVDVVEMEQRIYLTCVGSFIPSEIYSAALMFLEKKGDSFAAPKTLLKDLPRSVQAQFADFNGDGQEDFTLCMYGNRTGRFSWFENKGGKFEEHILLEHSGALYCHVRDFNGDGKPDLSVLFAQELEMLVVFLNQGKGEFSSNIIFQKPPVFGHSWFEPVDFNKDGQLDLVVVNGDNGEYESPTKNYHGIRVLLNDGDLQFHEAFFYPLNGAYKALARDFDGDGDLDIAAISYFPDYVKSPRESFVYLENLGNMKFKASTFSQCIAGRWLVMDAEDLDGDGALDIVLGSHMAGPKSTPLFLHQMWEKQARPVLILHNRLKEQSPQ